jgi:hypothetical protein
MWRRIFAWFSQLARHGQVHQASLVHPLIERAAIVGGAVVDDPEHSPRALIGLRGHHLLDQLPKGSMPVVGAVRPITRAACTSSAAR